MNNIKQLLEDLRDAKTVFVTMEGLHMWMEHTFKDPDVVCLSEWDSIRIEDGDSAMRLTLKPKRGECELIDSDYGMNTWQIEFDEGEKVSIEIEKTKK